MESKRREGGAHQDAELFETGDEPEAMVEDAARGDYNLRALSERVSVVVVLSGWLRDLQLEQMSCLLNTECPNYVDPGNQPECGRCL